MDIPIIHWYKAINTYIHIHTNTQILYANQYIQKLFFLKLDIFATSIHYFLLPADWVVLRVIVKALWAALVVLPCIWRQWHLMLLHPHHGKFLVVRMVRLSFISAFQGIHVYVLIKISVLIAGLRLFKEAKDWDSRGRVSCSFD